MTFDEILASTPPNQRPLVVGVVTYNRYDLAAQCVESIRRCGGRQPDTLVVVDNGGGFPASEDAMVVRPAFNRGYSGAINEIVRGFPGHDWMVFNDDMIVSPKTIAQAAESPGWFVSVNGYGCFLMRHPIEQIVGPWETGYWPMGPEDQDFSWRLFLAVKEPLTDPVAPLPGMAFTPEGGITLRGDTDLVHLIQGTGGTIGEWAVPWRARGETLLGRRWGARTEGYGYRFTYDRPYNGQPLDELALLVEEGIACGALPSAGALQELLAPEDPVKRPRRIAQVPGVSPYWTAAVLTIAPWAKLFVTKPLDTAWPAAWAVAGEHWKRVTLLDDIGQLYAPVDLMLVEAPESFGSIEMSRAIYQTYRT